MTSEDTTQSETPRERRHERTRDAIITTARKLIVEKGIDRLSLREIARRIDYSPAGLYEYFGSKDEIIDAVCHQANDRMMRSFRAVDDRLPLETYLLELGMAYIRFACAYPEDFTLMFSRLKSGLDHPPEGEELEDDNHTFNIIYKAVLRGVDTGEIEVDETFDTVGVAYALWSVVHGMATLQTTYLSGFNYDFAPVDRRALLAFLRGIILK